jgi:hypothetical protein
MLFPTHSLDLCGEYTLRYISLFNFLTVFIQDPVNGAQLAGSWAVRETFIAVVTTNAPVVFPIFRSWLGPVIGSIKSSINSTRSSKSTEDKGRSNFRSFGGGRRGQPSWKGRGVPTPNPITNLTYTESEERILNSGVAMNSLSTCQGKPEEIGGVDPGKIQKEIAIDVVREGTRIPIMRHDDHTPQIDPRTRRYNNGAYPGTDPRRGDVEKMV